jgi:hypothetical protein
VSVEVCQALEVTCVEAFYQSQIHASFATSKAHTLSPWVVILAPAVVAVATVVADTADTAETAEAAATLPPPLSVRSIHEIWWLVA